jgi:hypothetical protein
MAVFRIGRLFSDYDVDILSATMAGDRLTVAGDVVLSGSTRADAGKAVREQIVAMKDNRDERFVAVQWSQDTTINGYFNIVDIRCDMGQMHLTDGLLKWTADLQRVSGSQYAPIESQCQWQLLTNSRSVTSGTFTGLAIPQFGIPGSAFEIGPTSGTVSGAQSTIAGPTTLGTGFGTILTTTNVTVPANGIMGWTTDPTTYYYGGCLVTTDFGTATDQQVFGRRADSSTNWMVSNGMVRFFIENSNQTLTVELWDGSAWRQINATNYRFQSGGTTIQYNTMTILRNSPECVSVRLAHTVSSTKLRVYVDLSILRGSYMVYGYMSVPPTSSTWPSSATMGIQTTASIASSAITGGFSATSADANGDKFLIVTGAPACTDTLATGRTVTSAATTSLSFGISGSTGGVSLQNQAYEFFARRSEKTVVVAR